MDAIYSVIQFLNLAKKLNAQSKSP